MYLPGVTGAEAKARVGAGVGAQEAVSVGMGVLLPSMGAFGTSPASSSLLVERKLRRVRDLAI